MALLLMLLVAGVSWVAMRRQPPGSEAVAPPWATAVQRFAGIAIVVLGMALGAFALLIGNLALALVAVPLLLVGWIEAHATVPSGLAWPLVAGRAAGAALALVATLLHTATSGGGFEGMVQLVFGPVAMAAGWVAGGWVAQATVLLAVTLRPRDPPPPRAPASPLPGADPAGGGDPRPR